MTNHPQWTFLHPKMTQDHLGYLPQFLNLDNPAPATEQLHQAYQHGGGWNSFKGFKRVSPDSFNIQYPGDPVYPALAFTKLRDETIVFYPHSWVAVFQPDGSFEIARMD